eukprot:6648102-Prymnesium_polylepis.2
MQQRSALRPAMASDGWLASPSSTNRMSSAAVSPSGVAPYDQRPIGGDANTLHLANPKVRRRHTSCCGPLQGIREQFITWASEAYSCNVRKRRKSGKQHQAPRESPKLKCAASARSAPFGVWSWRGGGSSFTCVCVTGLRGGGREQGT